MEELTEEKVIQIHDFLIEEMGGEPGIRDFGTLSFIVEANIKDIIEKEANIEKIKDKPPDTVGDDNKTVESSAPQEVEEVEEILDGANENETSTKIIIKSTNFGKE